MAHDILVGNSVKTLERNHEESQRIEHLVRKSGLALIADHRDADRFFVPVSLLDMSTVHLLHPPRPNLDLTARFSARTVIDQKIVSHSVVPTALMMKAIDAIGAPLIGRCMVDHNMCPARCRKKRDVRPRPARVRDQKLHSLLELRLARQIIDAHDRRHINAVDARDAP